MMRWFALLLAASASLCAQDLSGPQHVKATLLADTTAVVPGQPFKVGVLLQMDPTWHTYWQYPGDAGAPTRLTWTLPAGLQAGPIEWPLPERLVEPGDIEVYAYGDQVLLLTTVIPAVGLKDSEVDLRVLAKWLVCAEICIPGSAELDLKLPVRASGAAPANTDIFQRFEALLPSANPPPYDLSWKTTRPTISLNVTGLGAANAVDLFPLPTENQQVSHPKDGPIEKGAAVISLETTGDLRGVLVVDTAGSRQGWYVASGMKEMPTHGLGLWLALGYGFLGGLILNLMPCVLPVISLKIFGFVRQAGDDPRKILRHGLAFAAGIFAWFLGLAAVIVLLKSTGTEVSWAFQFQSPWFILFICCVVFVFALNLFGVFEIVLPGRAQNALSEASDGHGYSGSFFQGVFATLLATPCTAPFLGSALAFALTQSAVVTFSIFAAISLGMSAPYLLLSARPGWMKILPKPGVWMERVKQFMGFPLLATLLWLLFVLGSQKGLEGLIWAASFLLVLGLICWIIGSFAGPLQSGRSRLIAWLLSLLILAGGAWYFLGKFVDSQRSDTSSASSEGGLSWQPFTSKALDDAVASGQPVFVDFTADWCISCKFNERTAINVPAVRAAMLAKKVVAFKGDWTNANPEISAVLKKYGRAGVPFYLFYPGGDIRDPLILPELLTQQIVLDAIAKAH